MHQVFLCPHNGTPRVLSAWGYALYTYPADGAGRPDHWLLLRNLNGLEQDLECFATAVRRCVLIADEAIALKIAGELTGDRYAEWPTISSLLP